MNLVCGNLRPIIGHSYVNTVEFQQEALKASPFQALQHDLACVGSVASAPALEPESLFATLNGKTPVKGPHPAFLLNVMHGGNIGQVPKEWLQIDPETGSYVYIRKVLRCMFPKLTDTQIVDLASSGSTASGHALQSTLLAAALYCDCFDFVRSIMFLHFGVPYFGQLVDVENELFNQSSRADWQHMFQRKYGSVLCPFDIDTAFYQLNTHHPTASYTALTEMMGMLLSDDEFKHELMRGVNGIQGVSAIISIHNKELRAIVETFPHLTPATLFTALDLDGTGASGWSQDGTVGTQCTFFTGPTGTGKTQAEIAIIKELVRLGKVNPICARALVPGSVVIVCVMNRSEQTEIVRLMRDALSADDAFVTSWSELADSVAPQQKGQDRIEVLMQAANGRVVVVVTCYAGLQSLICKPRVVERARADAAASVPENAMDFGGVNYAAIPVPVLTFSPAVVVVTELQRVGSFLTSDIQKDVNGFTGALRAVCAVSRTVLADGQLTDATVRLLCDLVGTNVSIHNLLPTRAERKAAVVFESPTDFAAALLDKLKSNKPLIVVSDSKACVYELREGIGPLTNRRVVAITADSLPDDTALLDNASSVIQSGVVLLLSPVAVSTLSIHGDCEVFALFVGRSVPYADMMQMLGRSRNAKEFSLFFANLKNRGESQSGGADGQEAKALVHELLSMYARRNVPMVITDLLSARLKSAASYYGETLTSLVLTDAFDNFLRDEFNWGLLCAAGVDKGALGPFAPSRGVDPNLKLRALMALFLGHTEPGNFYLYCLCGSTAVDDSDGRVVCDLCQEEGYARMITPLGMNVLRPNSAPAALRELQLGFRDGQFDHFSVIGVHGQNTIVLSPHDLARFDNMIENNDNTPIFKALSLLWLLQQLNIGIYPRRRSEFPAPIPPDLTTRMLAIDAGQLQADRMKNNADTVGDKLDDYAELESVVRAVIGAAPGEKVSMQKLLELFKFLTALGLPATNETLDTLRELETAQPLYSRFPKCGLKKNGGSVFSALLVASGFPEHLSVYTGLCVEQVCGQLLVTHVAGDADVVLRAMVWRRIEAVLALLHDIAGLNKSLLPPFVFSLAGITIPTRVAFTDVAVDKTSDRALAISVLNEVRTGSGALYKYKPNGDSASMTVRDVIKVLKKMLRHLCGMKLTVHARTGFVACNRLYVAIRLQALYLRLRGGMQVHANRPSLLQFLEGQLSLLSPNELVLFTAAGIAIPTAPPTLPRTDTVASVASSLPATQPYNPSQDVFDDDFDEKARVFLPRKLAGLTQSGIVVSLEHMQELWLRLSPFERGVILGTESVDNHQAIQLKFKAGTLLSGIIDEFGRRSSVLQATIEKMRAMQRTSTLDSMSSICGSLDPGLWRTIEDSSGDEDDLANSDTSDEEPQMRCPFIDGEAGESDCEDSVQSVAGTEGPSEYGSDRETQSYPKRQRTSDE